ncbi:putative disease resistance protein RGA3 [Ziziphus jujuba]|uniref:Disease resistance protein RGA3 n=1 Tax=Ziziphus jujuba TaxID=326968 RepID=A0ABM4AFK2_ZIZJJ|nr:putative disease resistance protein RGA3 [Ziziphus jujuba]
MWACVSDPFDEIKVAKAITESLKGSRVVVTTRKVEVATMMGAAAQMITMQLPSDEYCWSIFSGLAFRERNSEECKQLERVGRQIASKCQGLPLVAKSLGSSMRSEVTEEEWKDVLCSRFWELKDEQTKTFAPFSLSYYDLSPGGRRCFCYCSVFPKDCEFEKDGLVHMWMSQGHLSGSRNPEEESEKCFQILTVRSFFQDFEVDYDGSIKISKMHDILHDFAQLLTRNKCSTMRVEVNMEKAEPPRVEKILHS